MLEKLKIRDDMHPRELVERHNALVDIVELIIAHHWELQRKAERIIDGYRERKKWDSV